MARPPSENPSARTLYMREYRKRKQLEQGINPCKPRAKYRSANPTPQALYMREYRAKKKPPLSAVDKANLAIKEKERAWRRDPSKKHLFREAANTRRKNVYRARKVLESGYDSMTFRGEQMTMQDALNILRYGSKQDLLAQRKTRKPSPLKGKPRPSSYNTQAKVNETLRRMVLAIGKTPASPQLLPDKNAPEPFSIHRPINMTKALEEAEKQAVAKVPPEKAVQEGTTTHPEQALSPEALREKEADESFNRALASLKEKLQSQGFGAPPPLPPPTVEEEEHDPFGGQVFDFTPGT